MRKTLDIAIDISNVTQDKASITGEDYNQLIEEKKKCLGTGKSNQSTWKKSSIKVYHRR